MASEVREAVSHLTLCKGVNGYHLKLFPLFFPSTLGVTVVSIRPPLTVLAFVRERVLYYVLLLFIGRFPPLLPFS